MRIPGKSEGNAFDIVLGAAMLSGIAVLAGVAVTPLYGILVFAAGALGAVLFELLSPDPQRRRALREAAGSSERHASEPQHVLVVANELMAGPALRDAIIERGGPGCRIDILAPVLSSRARYWASDFDRELEEARLRLAGSLAWAASQGLHASGHVGDPDPYTALEDELRGFGADEVIVVTHPSKRANWLESGELARLRAELDVPVTHFVSDRERGSLEVGD